MGRSTNDKGVVLLLSGDSSGTYTNPVNGSTVTAEALTASYTTMAAIGTDHIIYGGNTEALSLFIETNQSDSTSIEVRITGRYTGDTALDDGWCLIQSTLQSSGATANEHSIATANDGHYLIQTSSHRGCSEIRIEAKRTGGTAIAGNNIRAAVVVN